MSTLVWRVVIRIDRVIPNLLRVFALPGAQRRPRIESHTRRVAPVFSRRLYASPPPQIIPRAESRFLGTIPLSAMATSGAAVNGISGIGQP